MNENKTSSRENDDLQRFYQAMAILRQKIDTLLKSIPNLLTITDLKELPTENVEFVENQLWDIFVYGEYYVEKIWSDISEQSIISVSEDGRPHVEYHKKKYQSFINKLKGLIDVSKALGRKKIEEAFVRKIDELNATDNDSDYQDDPSLAGCVVNSIDDEKYWVLYERYVLDGELWKYIKFMAERVAELELEHSIDAIQSDPNSDKNYHIENFRSIRWCAYYYLERIDPELKEVWKESVHPVDYDGIINKPYFKPDNWVANEKELSPVIVDRELEQLPQRIRARIHEIHSSFIFGHWMSVIALSRCLLEYAIIDRKSLLKELLKRDIEVRDDEGRTKNLYELISIAEEAFPELGERMDFIREQGKYVMHDTNVSPIRSLKDNAKLCVVGITEIISTLYSKPKNAGNPFN